jgi:tetratricopeptide (TPR) repeat protein
MPGKKGLSPALILLAITFLVYGNSLLGGFVHDDKPLVAQNLLIRDPGNLGRIFASGYWTTGDRLVPELYRPLVVASFAMNHLFGGLRPFGYHLANLLLQAWVCWLVYRVALAFGGAPSAAWAAALLFAIHPVHSEAVAPVVGRSELLGAGFALAALLLHRRALSEPARAAALVPAAAACFFAALLSKENALVLPGLMLLADAGFPPRAGGAWRWRAYASYAAAAALYLAARVAVLGAVARSDIRALDNPLAGAGFVTSRLTALITTGKYLGLLLWPFHLSADYSRDQIPLATGILDPRLAASLAILSAAAVLAVLAWSRFRLVAVALLWWAAALLPVSNLPFLIGTIFGERLLYLPSVGFCLLGGALFSRLHRRKGRLALLLGTALLLAFAARTAARNSVWHDDASFALATARDAPRSAKAQFNLGVFLEEHADLRGAEAAYRRAESLAPDWADPPYNRGGVLVRLGRAAEAIAEYRRAAALSGELRFALNLGYALDRAGRHAEAVELYRQRIRSTGESAALYNNLGASLLAMSRAGEAAEAYRKALSFDPANASYHANLALASEAAGDLATAEAELRIALAASPDSIPLLRSLGLLLARTGRREEAAQRLRRADSLIAGGLDPEARAVLDALSN